MYILKHFLAQNLSNLAQTKPNEFSQILESNKFECFKSIDPNSKSTQKIF